MAKDPKLAPGSTSSAAIRPVVKEVDPDDIGAARNVGAPVRPSVPEIDPVDVEEDHEATVDPGAAERKAAGARAAKEILNPDPTPPVDRALHGRAPITTPEEHLELMTRQPSYTKEIVPGEQVPLHAANLQSQQAYNFSAEKRRQTVDESIRGLVKKLQ